MWVLFDIDSAGSRQAQLRAGVLDGLRYQDVALPDGVVVRRRAARVGQFDVDDNDERVLVDAPPVDPEVPPVRDDVRRQCLFEVRDGRFLVNSSPWASRVSLTISRRG